MSFLATFLSVFSAILAGMGLIHCFVKLLQFIERKFDLKFLIPIVIAGWGAFIITIFLLIIKESEEDIRKFKSENKIRIENFEKQLDNKEK